jgi:hypothetical protein
MLWGLTCAASIPHPKSGLQMGPVSHHVPAVEEEKDTCEPAPARKAVRRRQRWFMVRLWKPERKGFR